MTSSYKSVRLKLAFITILSFLIIFVAISLTLDSYARQSLRDEFDNHVNQTLVVIKKLYAEDANEMEYLSTFLKELIETDEDRYIEQIRIHEYSDDKFITLTSIGRGYAGADPVSEKPADFENSYDEKGKTVLIKKTVTSTGGRKLLIDATFSKDHLIEQIRSIRIRSAIPAAIGVLLMTLFVYAAGERYILEPIDKMKNSVKKITDGDLEHDIEIDQKDELGELSRLLQKMKDSLVEHTRKLHKKLNELSVLYEVSELNGEIKNAGDSLEIIIKSAVMVLGGKSGSILLDDSLDDENHRDINEKVFWAENEIIDHEVQAANLKGAKKIFNSKQSLLITSGETYGPIKDAIGVPIRADVKILGVIFVNDKREGVFSEADTRLLEILANQALGIIKLSNLHVDLENSYLNTIQALAATLDAKDRYTHGHSDRVAQYSKIIAEQLGLSKTDLEAINTAAYLHDIGKIGISENILVKPSKLTPNEMKLMRTHPEISDKILQSVTFLDDVLPVVRHHHERYDGKGYPDGLSKDEIPLGARILSVADAYDAMVSNRPYRKALEKETAILELKNNSGTQFDPLIVEAFLKADPISDKKISNLASKAV